MANLSSVELTGHRPDEVAIGELGAEVADFIALLKPRVMSLVVFTGFVGLYLAPGHINPFLALVAVLCIAVGAGAAGAINMWYDRDIDAVMQRTRDRPLPAGRMVPGEALGFGCTLAGASVMVMGLAVNWAAAAVALTANSDDAASSKAGNNKGKTGFDMISSWRLIHAYRQLLSLLQGDRKNYFSEENLYYL